MKYKKGFKSKVNIYKLLPLFLFKMKRNLLKKLLTPILVAGTLFSTPALANQPQHTYTPGECITYRLENFDGTLEEACVEPQHDHPSQTSPESLTERFVLTTDIPETETTPKYEIFTAVKKRI